MQKLVKGATKPKEAAPKAKYIEPILATTYDGGRDFETVMESVSRVLSRSQAWTCNYKALIVIHIMVREGAEDMTLRYMSRHPRMLELDEHAHRAVGLGRYARYLMIRAVQFREVHVDDVRFKDRDGHSRLFSLPTHKNLLRGCESVIVQVDALVKCHYEESDVSNDVILMAFRLLVHDCLSLFQVLNEGVINLLEHFFELAKPDAEQALDIYRGFTRLTTKVIAYLRTAKALEYKTKLHVPNIKHAPTSLVSSLEMYLNDPDFDVNRRQYLAEKQAHEVKRSASSAKSAKTRSVSTKSAPVSSVGPPPGPPPQTAQTPASGIQPVPQVQVQPPAPASTQSNPFFAQQNHELSQQEALAQVQAARIQLQEGQAALQMQQLQFQQQQEAQAIARAQLQSQYTSQQQPPQPQQQQYTGYNMGFDFGQGAGQLQSSAQPQTQAQPPPQQPQPLPPQPTLQSQPQLQQQAQNQPQSQFQHHHQPQQQQQPLYMQTTGPAPQPPTAPATPAPQSTGFLGWPDTGFDFGQSVPAPTQSYGSIQTVSSQPTTPTGFGQDAYAHNPFKRNGTIHENGHNPFARQQAPQATGTNPFRLSMQ